MRSEKISAGKPQQKLCSASGLPLLSLNNRRHYFQQQTQGGANIKVKTDCQVCSELPNKDRILGALLFSIAS
ncbi:hypothetical protein CDAR_253051, partial [Caerostris darwini]